MKYNHRMFIGREKELDYLQEKYQSKRGELLIIYGRRRTGKTSILKKSQPDTYFLLTQEDSRTNLDSFKQVLAMKTHKAIASLQTRTWEGFFREAIDFIPENHSIVLDEFPYLIRQDKTILSQFQKIYDEYLKPKGITLVLCGSSISIMTDILEHDSPLYGRRTGSLKIHPFTLAETKEFLNMPAKEAIRYHLIFGGIPYYLEQVQQQSFKKNIKNLFFKTTGLFLDEAIFLLKQDFKEIRNYLVILKAISRGKTTFKEIADSTYLDKSSLSKYLANLEFLEMIVNHKSFFAKRNSKKTHYRIKDNYLYFWFKVIEKHLNNIHEKRVQQQIFDEEIPQALGYLFENECRRILRGEFERIGVYFDKEIEIDILAQKKKRIYCYECKFSEKINKQQITKQLNKKIAMLPPEYTYIPRVLSLEDITMLVEKSQDVESK